MLGDEDAVEDSLLEDLVGVAVVAMADAIGAAGLLREVEAGIDEILAVGEEVVHGRSVLRISEEPSDIARKEYVETRCSPSRAIRR